MVTRVLTPEEIARGGFGFDPTLTAPKIDPTVGSSGYDPEFDAVQRRLLAALQTQQSQTNEDVNNVGLDVGTRQHALETQHPTDIRNLLENFAGRGMAYSGRYAADNQANEDQYAGQLAGLDTEKANRLSAISRAMLKFQTDQQNTMNDAYGAYSQRAAAKAEQDAAAELAAKNVRDAAQANSAMNPQSNVLPGASPVAATTPGIVPGGGVAPVPNISPGVDPTTGQNGGAVNPSTGQYYPDPQDQANALGFNGPINMADPGPAGNNPAVLPLATPFTGSPTAQPNYAPPSAPIATAAPKPAAAAPLTGHAAEGIGSSTRPMSSFDAHSQNILHGGGTIIAGNGYHYRSVNGVPVRVA